MRVLGVDPGLTRCGLGVVDGAVGMRASLVEVGVVRTPAGVEVPERLRLVADGIDAWLDRTRPEAVAVEKVFSQANVRTVMGTAQAGAVAIMLAARRGLPVGLYTPSEVKAAVTGSGRADKAQVGFMIGRLLGLSEVPRPADAADALALALCHLWRGPALARLREASAAGAGSASVGAAGVGAAGVQTVAGRRRVARPGGAAGGAAR
jgi:crossover junction endodeoxyribonuclease RuvC